MGSAPLWRLAVVGGLATLALAACGGGNDESASPTTETTTEAVTETTPAETAERTPEPSELVAQLSDLPTGYSVDDEGTGPRTLAKALENTTPEQATVIRRERVEGYEVTFESPNLRVIGCTATVYRSSDGAEEVFRLAVEHAPEAAKDEGGTLEPASIEESLGDETAAFAGTFEGASTFTIIWRDRNVLGLCATGGLIATDPAETVKVARAQQERIAEALG